MKAWHGAILMLLVLGAFQWVLAKGNRAETQALRDTLELAEERHTAERDTLMDALEEYAVAIDTLRVAVDRAEIRAEAAEHETTDALKQLRANVPESARPYVLALEASIALEREAHERQLTLARAETLAERGRADALQDAYDASQAGWEAERALREKLEPGPSFLGVSLGDIPGYALAYVAGRATK